MLWRTTPPRATRRRTPARVPPVAATLLHERVLERSDGVLRRVLQLHRPHADLEGPTCRGCDSDGRPPTDPVWPCRTYTIIARDVLGVTDVEAVLEDLRRHGLRQSNPAR